MARRIPHIYVRLMMAATVLAWSLSPPGVRHTHDGGNEPSHHHECGEAHHHATDASHGSHPAHDKGQNHPLAVVSEVSAGEVSHLHFQWFGFRLAFPDDELPSKKGEERSNVKLLFIQTGHAFVPQFHSGGRFDKSPTFLCPDAMATGIATAYPAVSCAFLPITPTPLCDRARHERSGVQLA